MRARWLARAAFVLMFAAAAVLIGFPERHARGALATVAIGAVAACLIAAGGYWYLAHRGVVRQVALGLVVLVPIAVLVVFAWRHVIWVAVVAVVLLALRDAGRQPDTAAQAASAWVPAEWVELLSLWRHREARPGWTVGEFLAALGRLGGHQNRPSDGPPGWLTLWRGWDKLRAMLAGATLAASRSGGT